MPMPVDGFSCKEINDKFEIIEELKNNIKDSKESVDTILKKCEHGNKIQRNDIQLRGKLQALEEKIAYLLKERDEKILTRALKDLKIRKLEMNSIALNDRRLNLQQLIDSQQNILQCLQINLESNADMVDFLRWRSACELFTMMKIIPSSMAKPRSTHHRRGQSTSNVSNNKKSNTSKASDQQQGGGMNTVASLAVTVGSAHEAPSYVHIIGCSTILGLPLQNNGKYDGTPVEIVTSALAHVGYLTNSLAVALNIPLPHGIKSFDLVNCCYIQPQCNDSACLPLMQAIRPEDIQLQNFEWNGIKNDLKSKDIKLGGGGLHANIPEANSSNAVRENSYSQRGLHLNKSYQSALSLLQADVLILCLKCGLPPETLWPAPAILLNLHVLHDFCVKKAKND